MNVFRANVMNEVEKMFLKKKTFVLLIITAIIPIIAALILSAFQNNIGIIPVNGQEFSIFVLGIFTDYILPLFITMAAVDLFTAEFGDRTAKIVLLRPISRIKIFISKVVCILIYILVNLLIAFIISSIAGLFLHGTGDFIKYCLLGLAAYCVSVLPLICIAIIVVFIAQLFKNSSGAIVITIIIYIALSVVSRLFPAFARILPTSYTDWYLFWIGSSVLIGKIFNAFVVILSYCLIFFAWGVYLFDKREF